MSSSLFTRELQRIVIFVRECGGDAVIDGDSVVIFASGKSHSEIAAMLAGQSVTRVRTLAEAWIVLEMERPYSSSRAA